MVFFFPEILFPSSLPLMYFTYSIIHMPPIFWAKQLNLFLLSSPPFSDSMESGLTTNVPITDFYKVTLVKVITSFGSPIQDPCNPTFREVEDACLSCVEVLVKLAHSSTYEVGEWDMHDQVQHLSSSGHYLSHQ